MSQSVATTRWNDQPFTSFIASQLPLEASILSIITEQQPNALNLAITIPLGRLEHQIQDFTKVQAEIDAANDHLLNLQLSSAVTPRLQPITQSTYSATKNELNLEINLDAVPVFKDIATRFPAFGSDAWRELESRHSQLTYLYLQAQASDHGEVTLSREQLASELGINAVLPDTMITKLVVTKVRAELNAHDWFPVYDLKTTDQGYQLIW